MHIKLHLHQRISSGLSQSSDSQAFSAAALLLFLLCLLCSTIIMQLCVCVHCIQEEQVSLVCWPSVTATQKAEVHRHNGN